MKRNIFIIIIVFFLFHITSFSIFAHGGFEKHAGNILVEILQDPLSPRVGEKVTMYFRFKDQSITSRNASDQNLKKYSFKLAIIDTFPNDESKDTKIYEKELRTDVNGNASFSYTFSKENYFDIDLSFLDSHGKLQETGFLIHPRESYSQKLIIGVATITFLLGSGGGIIIRKYLHEKG
jgi:hypothetical protein